ncbi:MAG: hypothetical protein IKS27_05795 [Oscillospiraceae bacterium]|nr:hypothetical protein [Oscillospiraceae bacterium]
MASGNEIFDALQPLGFETCGEFCFGTWRGYAVALQKFTSRICYVHVAVRVDRPASFLRRLRRATKVRGLKVGGTERAMKNEVLFSISFAKAEDIAALFSERMDVFIDALRENGIDPADTCALTGRTEPDSLCLTESNGSVSYQPVCAAAVREQTYQAQEQVRSNELSGNYVLGLVGAVLGMLVGLIPNLLTILFLEQIFGILFFLVPVAAMFGYKTLRGKMNAASVVIVILVSLLGVILIPYLEIVFYLVRDYKIAIGDALRATGGVLFTRETLSELRPRLLLLLLFMVLGILASLRLLKKGTNRSVISSSEIQLASLRPNPYRIGADSAGRDV